MDPDDETVVSHTVLRWGVAIDEIMPYSLPLQRLNRRFVAAAGDSMKFTHWFEDACTWPMPEMAQDVAKRIRPAPGEFVAVVLIEEPRYDG